METHYSINENVIYLLPKVYVRDFLEGSLTWIVLPHDDIQSFVLHDNRLDILSVPHTVQCVQYGRHLNQHNSSRSTLLTLHLPQFSF